MRRGRVNDLMEFIFPVAVIALIVMFNVRFTRSAYAAAAQIAASPGGYGPIIARDASGSPVLNDSTAAHQAHSSSASR